MAISLRRRYLVAFFSLCAVALFFTSPWNLPESLKDSSFSLSRTSAPKLAKAAISEIYGLLHLVTQDHDHDHILNNVADPSSPLDLDVYAAGDAVSDWDAAVKLLNKKYPIVVFSKSYCPYSKRAKKLLSRYDIQPQPKIVEVDLREDSDVIKTLLTRLTGQSTFPNIIVRGKSIGGSDDLQILHYQGSLIPILEDAGAVVKFQGDEK